MITNERVMKALSIFIALDLVILMAIGTLLMWSDVGLLGRVVLIALTITRGTLSARAINRELRSSEQKEEER